jgi:hypothetical protein
MTDNLQPLEQTTSISQWVVQSFEDLFAALAKAQGEMKNPTFDSVNPHLRSRYASLAAVRNAVIPPLAANGLARLLDCRTTPVGVSVTTHLLHSSGQRMTFGPLEIPASKLDAQGFGAAETYARRFALLGLACVAGEADADGDQTERITIEQAKQIDALIVDVGADRDAFLKYVKAESVEAIPVAMFDASVKMLEDKRRKGKAK